MSKSLALVGESGQGKTTALRTLPPDRTVYIDADGKGLSWKGWKQQYNKESKNYIVTDDQNTILTCMHTIDTSPKYSHVNYIVIDTLNSVMIADENRRRAEKSYDKWSDLAWSIYDIVQKCNKMRDDLTVILIAHTQTDVDDMTGERFTRILTNGKKLNKIGIEKYLTTVLMAKQVDGEYRIITKDPSSTVKAPMGAFETESVPNDIMIVLNALEEF